MIKDELYLIDPVNFSRTDLGPTHIISAEAILAVTLVTYHNQENNMRYTDINQFQHSSQNSIELLICMPDSNKTVAEQYNLQERDT